MKTLKSFLFIAMFTTIAIVASANYYNVTDFKISPTIDLKSTIGKMVESDFVNSESYLQQNDIKRLKEDVVVTFYITKEKTVKLVSANCENKVASEYVMQLLNNSKINIDEYFIGKKFVLKLKLDYCG